MAKRTRSVQAQAAEALYHAEVRAFIARALSQNRSVASIAKQLQIPRRHVEAYAAQSIERLRAIGPHFRGSPLQPDDMPKRRGRMLGQPGGGPHRKGSPKAAPAPAYVDGEVVLDPEEQAFRRRAFQLRKRALPFDEIADLTGRSIEDCRAAVRAELRLLERDELQDTALAKRMMLEQIDAMIAAITLPATGKDDYGNPREVAYDAIDRMVKLLDRKAKLLGLDAPQRVDLHHRIEVMAEETGYDVQELRDIAAEVIKSRSVRALT